MREIGIGLLGFGTVGAGVVDTLARHGDLLAARTGIRLALRAIADLDVQTDRGVPVDRGLLTNDAEAVIDDPRCEVIAELIGGTGAARELVLRALARHKPVVTANKALLAEHGAELFRAARAANTGLFFEASVAGGVPVIRAIQEGLVANEHLSLDGILNGTCNYILTRMEEDGRPFGEVLEEAQEAGYAEADPGLDIDGIDAAHKATILAALAHGRAIPFDQVPVRGIRGIARQDIGYARELGYRIKLLAVVRRWGAQVEVTVQPALVAADHLLARVRGVYNAVLVNGDIVGTTLYTGRGAGRYPTASAVIADLADAGSRILTSGPWNNGCFLESEGRPRLKEPGSVCTRHYLRLPLRDRPGVIARVARALGDHHISIASIVQKEQSQSRHVPVIVITHEAAARDVAGAVREIDAMDCVGGPAVHFRIEDFKTGA